MTVDRQQMSTAFRRLAKAFQQAADAFDEAQECLDEFETLMAELTDDLDDGEGDDSAPSLYELQPQKKNGGGFSEEKS